MNPIRWAAPALGLVLLAAPAALLRQDTRPAPPDALEVPQDIRTVDNARTAADRIKGKKRASPDLGIRFGLPAAGGLAVQQVVRGGPAEEAEILPDDIVRSIGTVKLHASEDLEVAMAFMNVGKPVRLSVETVAVKRDAVVVVGGGAPATAPGFEFKRANSRFVVTGVTPGSPAAAAGLKSGDTFTRIDQTFLPSTGAARKAMEKKERFTVHVDKAGSRRSCVVTPAAAKEEEVVSWKGKSFALAVLLVEFADVKRAPGYVKEDFAKMLFSTGEYLKSPDGRPTYGSMGDYYREISVGQFDLDGEVFDWVTVPEPWAYYDRQDMGSGDGSARTVFDDALRAVRKKHGSGALAKFDGVVFLYAGERRSLRGSQLWPHRSSIEIGGRSVPYYITEEGGKKFGSIGVHCHEFGHMLGLPDFYGYGHRTGVGRFCTMAIGHQGAAPSGPDRPFHFCAWCKIRLGWLTPTVVHPGDQQHLALRPVVGSTKEAVKVLVSPSGDEYFLLEVRTRKGFDSDFFRDGLLIWHVGEDGQREKGQIPVAIDLEEAHGKRYFDASLREEDQAVFPSRLTSAFSGNTFPSSRSNLAGAYQVDILDIRVFRPPAGAPAAAPPSPAAAAKHGGVPPGSVFMRIGDRARAAQIRGEEPEQPVYPEAEPVTELDPVTELPVPFHVGTDNVAKPGPAIMPREPAVPAKKDGEAGEKKGPGRGQ